MAEIECLKECIHWIGLSFVELERTPEWPIQVDIRYHLAGILLRYASKLLEALGLQPSHVAIHDWAEKADLQPISMVSSEQIAVNEKAIRVNGDDYWLYDAADLGTNEILHLSSFQRQRNRRYDGVWPISPGDIS